MDRENDQLASVVDAVLASTKYRDVSHELISYIAAQELRKRRSVKDALKATKNKLHQVGGAYLDSKEHYARWLEELTLAARTGQRERLLELCSIIMDHHASTRERIPMDFLQAWSGILHVGGKAQVCDVIQTCPTQQADVAFLLKVIPCLEQVDKMAGHRLLRELHADNLVVSFPIQSLGGRSKGMLEHYETHFRELLGNEPQWEVKRLVFDTELVFVVRK